MIKSIFQSLLISVGIAYLAQIIFDAIGSNYVFEFLKLNIINLQIGLLAINAATIGIVLTKLRDIADKGAPLSKFNSVRKEMLLSIREQVALITAALIILSLSTAHKLPMGLNINFFRVLLTACFVYSLLILYDTARSVFVVLDRSPES